MFVPCMSEISVLTIFRYVCEVVSRRASFMASAGITALLKKMDYKVKIRITVISCINLTFVHHLRTW